MALFNGFTYIKMDIIFEISMKSSFRRCIPSHDLFWYELLYCRCYSNQCLKLTESSFTWHVKMINKYTLQLSYIFSPTIMHLVQAKNTFWYEPGITLERVRRVHPHPLKSGHGCAAPVLKWPQTSEKIEYFLLLTKINVLMVYCSLWQVKQGT